MVVTARHKWWHSSCWKGQCTSQHSSGRYTAKLHNQLLISLHQEHQVHFNWVKVINLPLSFFTRQQSTVSSAPADQPSHLYQTHPFVSNRSDAEQPPWIKMEVIVCKIKHPMKGYRAIIKDVLPLQDTQN
jgi:hypothetical protein